MMYITGFLIITIQSSCIGMDCSRKLYNRPLKFFGYKVLEGQPKEASLNKARIFYVFNFISNSRSYCCTHCDRLLAWYFRLATCLSVTCTLRLNDT